MKLAFSLLILLSVASRGSCPRERKPQPEPLHVCDVVDRIDELQGQRVVVQGIFSWEDRHGTAGLLDCRPHQCRDQPTLVLVRGASKEARSALGVDDSYSSMRQELAKQRIYKVIVTLEVTLKVEDDILSNRPPGAKMIVLDIPSVKSRKALPLGEKRLNYCD